MPLFAGVGITLALFFGLLLLTKRDACTADRWLSAWFFTLFLHAGYLFTAANQSTLPSFVSMFCHPLFLLYGPIMLSYVMQVSHKRTISLWHFAPYIFFVVSFFVVLQFGQWVGATIAFEGLNIVTRDGSAKWLFLLLNGSMGLYLLYPVLAIRQLKQHKKRIESSYSDLTKVELNWALVWIYFSLLGVFIAITVNLLPDSLTDQRWVEWILFAVIDLQMLYVGIHGLQQTQIFVGQSIEEKETVTPQPAKPKTKPAIDLTDDIAFLTGFMTAEKPYLENSLMSEQLAKRLKWPTTRLTTVLNQGLNQSFFEFINRYRIEAAKATLTDPKYQNCTLLAVAHDVGFNSKTTFNTAFKKYQGMTPSQFRKSHNSSLD